MVVKSMDKYVILSEGAPFGSCVDTIWGYVTSEKRAKELCNLWGANGGRFYYIKNLSHDGRINFDSLTS